eukprot:Rmarinus@m.5006
MTAEIPLNHLRETLIASAPTLVYLRQKLKARATLLCKRGCLVRKTTAAMLRVYWGVAVVSPVRLGPWWVLASRPRQKKKKIGLLLLLLVTAVKRMCLSLGRLPTGKTLLSHNPTTPILGRVVCTCASKQLSQPNLVGMVSASKRMFLVFPARPPPLSLRNLLAMAATTAMRQHSRSRRIRSSGSSGTPLRPARYTLAPAKSVQTSECGSGWKKSEPITEWILSWLTIPFQRWLRTRQRNS